MTFSRRGFARLLVAPGLSAVLLFAAVAEAGPLISRELAATHGLQRAWFTQLGVDPSRSEVSQWFLHYGQLFGVTTSGAAFSVDSETGEPLWVRQISPPGRAAFGPSANQQYVAVVSGSKLYLLDRSDGRTRWIRDLGSAPGAGPALSNNYAFVAMVTGRIEAYRLNSPDAQPWYYQSKGRAYLQPTITGRVVTWPTDQGYLYVARAADPQVLYRLETDAEIVASPAYADEYLFVASLDGYLYCIEQMSGQEAWRFSTGYAIEDAPAVVGDRAYVGSFKPALHAIDVPSGRELWSASGLSQFVAKGKHRVYAADRYGNLAVLEADTGARLGTIPVAEGLRPLVNDTSDRIYLVSDEGLVQCLHEIGMDQPLIYREPPTVAEEEAEPQPTEAPAEQPPAEQPAPPQPEPPVEQPTEESDEPDTGSPFGDFDLFGE